MLTKSEVIASLNSGVKSYLDTLTHAALSSAYDETQINGTVDRFMGGLQRVRSFHERALKAIETEFKDG